MVIDPKPLDFAIPIREAVDSVRHAALAKRIEITLDEGDGPYLLVGDAGRLRQVVWNLLSNAIRYTAASGRVDVRLSRVNGHFELTVRDTGKGIEPSFLPFVWERFRQGDGSTTRSHGGLGLGLSIVRSIVVDLHGGEVGVESEGIDKGSTFRVRLPVIPPGDRILASQAPSSSTGDARGPRTRAELFGRRIVVVDDEEDGRELLCAALSCAGAAVAVAASAEEGLAAVLAERTDALVSDIGMPVYDGYWLIRELRRRARTACLPAVALTAYTRPVDVERALDAGFDRHVVKPIEPGALLSTLTTLLR